MYKVIMQIQDDETKETDVKEKIFSSIEEAQKYICEYFQEQFLYWRYYAKLSFLD